METDCMLPPDSGSAGGTIPSIDPAMQKRGDFTGAPSLHSFRGLLAAVFVSLMFLASCDSTGREPAHAVDENRSRDIGYDVLRTLLGDEQHIDTLSLVKTVINLRRISDLTRSLVDDIAAASAASLEDIDRLAGLDPPLVSGESSPDELDQAVIDTLRMTTATNLLMASGDDFELLLIVSQIQALRLISHLSDELRKIDPNPARQAWLTRLAARYEQFYSRAVARLSLAAE